jgi:6-phosphogluconate dehydrogenase
MKIAIHGLGRMGMQIARKLADSDHAVIAHNRSLEPIKEAESHGAIGADSKQAVLDAFGNERPVIWIMIPADVVDQELHAWLELLPEGSILIDGGNSDYRLTKQRNQLVQSKGHSYIDVGTSGGVWGYQNGFSMMVGGNDTKAVQAIEGVLQTLAAPEGAYYHFGESGSGHFVKMVHNAIEYGMMESLAEGYRMLKEGPYRSIDLAAAGNVWQHHSVITSWLNELSQAALQENPELEGIDGYVAESGEARWTLETAKDINLPMPSIQAAFDVRLASQQGEINFATKLLSAMRNKFGGHQLNK